MQKEQKRLPWKSQPGGETPNPGRPWALSSAGAQRGQREPPGPSRDPQPASRRARQGSTHIVLGGVPPLLHVHHGGILHAVGEHLFPQHSEWRPPAASPSHPGRAPAFLLPLPRSWGHPPPRPCALIAARGSRRAQFGPRGRRRSRRARGAPCTRATSREPAPRPPCLPRRRRRARIARRFSPAPGGVRRELAQQRRGGGVSRWRGHGAGAPEPAVSALGRGRRRP